MESIGRVAQGFYQSVEATASLSLVNTVHLLTGAIGKPGAGPVLMAGQSSAMLAKKTRNDDLAMQSFASQELPGAASENPKNRRV